MKIAFRQYTIPPYLGRPQSKTSKDCKKFGWDESGSGVRKPWTTCCLTLSDSAHFQESPSRIAISGCSDNHGRTSCSYTLKLSNCKKIISYLNYQLLRGVCFSDFDDFGGKLINWTLKGKFFFLFHTFNLKINYFSQFSEKNL